MSKILIIEDEKAIARIMEIQLRKNGFDALAVFSGDEGCAELEKNIYDIVLLDIMMPGMDGWSVMERIKEKGLPVKVIVTSNLSQEEDKQKAKAMGAVDFLAKSDSALSTVINAVRLHLR